MNASSQTPSYFDLQINGYDGVDFNAEKLDPADLARACLRLQSEGVTGILATIITADLDTMSQRLRNIVTARGQNDLIKSIVRGIHIEGPFISPEPGYVGAHPAEAVRPASRDAMQKLLDAAEGLCRIVTLAPEYDKDCVVTRWLSDQGITVSAGHCNPNLKTLRASIDAGLSMFTHLGNGCPLQLHRHDNIIQRVLANSYELAIGFIADGVHVPYPALKNYLSAAGIDRTFIVTDAIAAAGRGPGEFRLGQRTVIVDGNLATWAENRKHLVGSALTMSAAVQNLRQHLGLDDEQIQRLCSDNPRRAINEPMAP